MYSFTKEHIRRYGRFCDAAKVPHSKANIRYDGSSSDLTKTKAYQRYHEMMKNADERGIIHVNKTNIRGIPNSITQVTTKNGGITRNYYGTDGKQVKQITNNNHGTPKSHPWGINGEHAHDYIWENETLKSRPGRELTEIERKENSDIL